MWAGISLTAGRHVAVHDCRERQLTCVEQTRVVLPVWSEPNAGSLHRRTVIGGWYRVTGPGGLIGCEYSTKTGVTLDSAVAHSKLEERDSRRNPMFALSARSYERRRTERAEDVTHLLVAWKRLAVHPKASNVDSRAESGLRPCRFEAGQASEQGTSPRVRRSVSAMHPLPKRGTGGRWGSLTCHGPAKHTHIHE